MNIILTRGGARTRMLCRRADGTFTSADLGASLPGHDFAHLVVERTLRLPSGFFVNIAKGYTIQQLSGAATIRSLGHAPVLRPSAASTQEREDVGSGPNSADLRCKCRLPRPTTRPAAS
jgi:hypothetical protein